MLAFVNTSMYDPIYKGPKMYPALVSEYFLRQDFKIRCSLLFDVHC